MDLERALLIKKFDSRLAGIIGADLPILKEVKKFVVKSGGKRIRPLTHYYFARILGCRSEEWLDVGAIGELIHAASLLHDDVVDTAELRRGKPTINKIFNNKTAILSGDYLLSCGLDHLRTLEHFGPLLEIFTRVIRLLAVGELLQMEWETNFRVAEETYDRIIHGKTAALFGAMTESAVVVAGGDRKARQKHREFGERMGRVFQIRDDYLDYFGSARQNGKHPFQDFQRGLMTRPVIVLRSLLKGKDRKMLEQLWTSAEERSSLSGQEKWRELAGEANLQKSLSSEIERDLGMLAEFLDLYPRSEYTEKIRTRLEELTVPSGSDF